MKDYYKIMDVPYDASPAEIRLAYHSQAKKYHPDINPGNESAAKLFIEIQEAYFILSDEDRRHQFHIRTHYPMAGGPKVPAETPETIVNKARKLNRLLKEIDVFRMNTLLFNQAVFLLLSDKNIAILNKGGNVAINRLIVDEILQICRIVSYKQVLKICNRLLLITGNDEKMQKSIYHLINQKRIRNIWDQYNVIIISFITLLICLLILIISN